MNIKFGNEVIDARHLSLATGSVRNGDLLVVNGKGYRVITIQRDCPIWESNKRTITMFTVEDEEKHVIPMRDIYGVVEVFRPRKKG